MAKVIKIYLNFFNQPKKSNFVANHQPLCVMKQRIQELKKSRNAIILAHYYTTPDIQDIADFVGDSLALSQKAATTSADVILFAGVHFMAETAKIISPDKIVLIPDPAAGCSLADSCRAEDLAAFKAEHPDHTVVCYINTTAEVKALTDITCTSSNAVAIVNSIPADRGVIFAPDRNLGRYIQEQTGRQNMLIWDGACHVHEEFSLARILELKGQYPQAKILAHPECKQPVLMVADHVGSTAELLAFSKRDTATAYIVATESGILHLMRQESPNKLFIPAPGSDSTCGCNDCAYMKLVTLDKIARSLETLEPRVELSAELIEQAAVPIRRMLDISAKLGLI